MSKSEFDRATNSEQRIRQIVKRARRETGLRDLITFCVARIWTVLLILGAVCSAWYAVSGDHTQSLEATPESLG